MVVLKRFGVNELIFFENHFIVYNKAVSSHKIVKIPDPQTENLSKSLEEVLKPEHKVITSVCISRDSKYLAVVLQNRQLVTYDSDLNVVSNILSKRAGSKAAFTDCSNVLLADKTGDVYLYRFKEVQSEPVLLLGHLSMLLDVALSECGRYVITCDRDEKIRVSSYPNAYNIVSYCLGHKEFVSHLVVLNDVLVSASGDGTIRFWDFINGKEMFMLDTNNYTQKNDALEVFRKEMDEEKVFIEALPIVDMQIFENVIAVGLLGCKELQLYHINRCKGQIRVSFLQNLTINSEIVAFSLSNELIIFTDTVLKTYKSHDNNKKFVEISCTNVKELFIDNTESVNVNNKISTLYKRKFDNLQDYLERKKLRLENKI